MAYLGDIAPGGDVGKLGGVYNVFGDLGSTLGPLVALPLASAVGVTGEYLLCVAFVGLTVLVVVFTLDGDPAPLKQPDLVAEAD
jgi:MFS family permease